MQHTSFIKLPVESKKQHLIQVCTLLVNKLGSQSVAGIRLYHLQSLPVSSASLDHIHQLIDTAADVASKTYSEHEYQHKIQAIQHLHDLEHHEQDEIQADNLLSQL